MPSIYLAKFRQVPYFGAAAHWAIFVPDANTGYRNGIPTSGVLFHALSQWLNCLQLLDIGGGSTFYDRQPNCDLSACPTLFDCYCLQSTNVSDDAIIDAACVYVSRNRGFNFMARNCQEWVKEVIRHLIYWSCIPETVLGEMEQNGYVTLHETCVHCSQNSSSSLYCRCTHKRWDRLNSVVLERVQQDQKSIGPGLHCLWD